IADREAERAMRALIEAACPDHGICGEEFPAKAGDGEWHWYLDPIDGTKAFITGIPLFGTLIGLAHRGRPVIGVMEQPIIGERWLAGADGAVNLNGEAIHTSANDDLARASLITTAMSYYQPDQARAFERLSAAAGLTGMGGDCYAFGMLAAGFVDLVVECNLNEWDLAALVPIIENAGGVITDWQGRPLRFDGQVEISTALASANQALHAQALDLLQT
ncbi:MAG: inositol monophosphatase family protein, partial [Alphaproteobacteria bacterium]|nr:inositol monophosphatase family protein [Alphaproteobacteria bacterium]